MPESLSSRSPQKIAAVILASGFVLVLCALAPSARPLPGIHPVAALAWVKTDCNPTAEIKPGAATVTADQLFEAIAALDALARLEGRMTVCRHAIAHSASYATTTLVVVEMTETIAQRRLAQRVHD